MLYRRRTDPHQVDHVRKIGGFEPARYRAFAALDDIALDVHLAEPALGVALRPGDDRDVVDSLTCPGANRETVANHVLYPPVGDVVPRDDDFGA